MNRMTENPIPLDKLGAVKTAEITRKQADMEHHKYTLFCNSRIHRSYVRLHREAFRRNNVESQSK